MTLQEAIALNLTLAVGLILLLRGTSTRSGWARVLAVAMMVVPNLGYLAWRCGATLPEFAASPGVLWCWLFFACEAAAVVYETWCLSVLARTSDRSARADILEADLRRRRDLPTVDVFIATYNESAPILEETIRGTLGLDYPAAKLKVWVLDDSRRPWLKALCASRGVGYLARPTNEGGKAGNLNYAFPRTRGDVILTLDADFIVRPNFLYRTLGLLLEGPGVGLVQTPQHFRNPDPIQHNLMGSAAWTEEQNFFMEVVEPSRDAHGNAFCVGTGFVVKRACLEELGGFAEGSICEDLQLSYALLSRGYRTRFLNEPLTSGLAPESVPEYVKQRVRWCTGTIQQAFLKTGPFRSPTLSLIDRLFYLETILYWVTYSFVVMLLVSPCVFWCTGVPAFACPDGDALFVLLPRIVSRSILMYWLSEQKVTPVITTVQKVVPAFHLLATVARSFVKPFGSPFKVTTKGEVRDKALVQWPIFSIFLILGLILGIGMSLNLAGYWGVVPLRDATLLDIGWSFYALLVLILSATVCVDLPKGSAEAEDEVSHANLGRTIRAVAARLFA